MVSVAVAERIMRIASEMGYARSPLASGLRAGKSYTIGVIIPDLSNPVLPPVVRGIERTLSADGYIAILADSDNSQQSERAVFDSMKSRRIDGLILANAHTEDPIVTDCVDEQLPVVLVNRTTDKHDELGVQAADLLLAEIRNHETPRRTIHLDPNLVVRASTAPPRNWK